MPPKGLQHYELMAIAPSIVKIICPIILTILLKSFPGLGFRFDSEEHASSNCYMGDIVAFSSQLAESGLTDEQ